MRTTTRLLGLCLLLVGSTGAPVWSETDALRLLVPPIALGQPGTIYRNPAAAVAPNGTITVVGEAGAVNAGRLVLADLSPTGWNGPETLDFAGPGNCSEPAAAYDSSGTLHLAWSERRGKSAVIRYARRPAAGQWSDAGVLSTTPELNCGFPSVACDRVGRIWATWQAGQATHFAVHLTWRDELTSSLLDVTGPRGDHHNLYPQLFPDSPYPVVWYEETGNSFHLRSAVPDLSRTQFDVVSPLEFDRLDANQMPWLFQAPSGMLGGVWTDLVGNRVRVLVGFQGPSTRGEGIVADTAPGGDAAQPHAVAVGENTVALAWTGRLPTGSAVFVGRVDGTAQVGPSLALPLPTSESFSRPRLVSGGGRVVHCVWFSDAARGGSGNLFYAALQF